MLRIYIIQPIGTQYNCQSIQMHIKSVGNNYIPNKLVHTLSTH